MVPLNGDDLYLKLEVGNWTGILRKPLSLQLSKGSLQTALQRSLNKKVVQSQIVKCDSTEAPIMRKPEQWAVQSLFKGGLRENFSKKTKCLLTLTFTLTLAFKNNNQSFKTLNFSGNQFLS